MRVRSAVAVLLVASLGLVDAFLLTPAAVLRPVPASAKRVHNLGLRAATSQRLGTLVFPAGAEIDGRSVLLGSCLRRR